MRPTSIPLPIRKCVGQRSTVQERVSSTDSTYYCIVPHPAGPYRTAPYTSLHYSVRQCTMVLCSTGLQYNTVQHSAIENPQLHCGTVTYSDIMHISCQDFQRTGEAAWRRFLQHTTHIGGARRHDLLPNGSATRCQHCFCTVAEA